MNNVMKNFINNIMEDIVEFFLKMFFFCSLYSVYFLFKLIYSTKDLIESIIDWFINFGKKYEPSVGSGAWK